MREPKNLDVPISPCGADFSKMTPVGARERLCAACDKVVHDLSGRSDPEIESLLAAGPVCVRYYYDAYGARLDDVPADAKLVPAAALLTKASRSRWARVAALAAATMVFEACGAYDPGDRMHRNMEAEREEAMRRGLGEDAGTSSADATASDSGTTGDSSPIGTKNDR